jgi:hypothetical protein
MNGLGHIGSDDTGANFEYGDIVFGQTIGKELGDHGHAGLAHAVFAPGGGGSVGGNGADIHDAGSVIFRGIFQDLHHGVGCLLAKEEGALVGLAGQRDSGRFVSEQSPNLILCIDWESVIGEDGVADVAVTVGISHYRFFSRAKSQMGAVQVDGNAILFDTPAIEYDENTKSYTFFGSYVFETDRSEMEVEASWQVLGTYGGIEIDTLTAGGTIVLAGEP